MDQTNKVKKKVLVVDDNEDITNSLSKIIKILGHDVVGVFNGNQALHAAREFKPDVVILDIGLPDVSGYDVAKVLRKEQPPLVIIAITGYGQIEDKKKALAAGFDQHLTKPVSIDEIEKLITV